MSASQESLELERPGVRNTTPEEPEPDGLRRELHPKHIFAIAISAIIGMGFYVRVGVIESLGGQAAVIYAYGFLGVLCLMIMTCLAVMLCIWPIAGALVVFVERFVDPEIGQSVGLLYWLTYCFSFAGLTTAIGQLVDYLDVPKGWSIFISVVSLLLPILFNLTDIRVFRNIELVLAFVKLSAVFVIIIITNIINPQVGGSSTTQSPAPSLRSRDIIFQHPNDASWFGVLMASIFLASFSYVGIEVVAATAQEAKAGHSERATDARQSTQNTAYANGVVQSGGALLQDTETDALSGYNTADTNTGREATNASSSTPESVNQASETNGFSRNIATSSLSMEGNPTIGNQNMHISTDREARNPAAAMLTHRSTNQVHGSSNSTQDTGVGQRETENDMFGQHHMARKSPFPSLAKYVPLVAAMLYLWGAWSVTQNVAWDDESQPSLANGTVHGWSNSIFINSAKKSSIANLDRGLAGVLILNIASTSSTALYVASRTLFGLTFTISTEMSSGARGWRKWWLRLMKILSKKSDFDVPYVAVLMSIWGLILPFLKYVDDSSYSKAIDVVTEMGSVSCVLVWGWESFAAYRFFRCCRRHRENDVSATTDKNIMDINDKGWYLFHLTIALFASIMCPIIVFVGGAFTVLHNNNATQGVATFLVVGIFLGLTLLLKLIRWGRNGGTWWTWASLVPLDNPPDVSGIFDELNVLKRKHIDKSRTKGDIKWLDFGGIINSDWVREKIRRE